MVVPSWTEIVKKMTRKVGVKVPNRIITCSNYRHGMGVQNGNPIWRCDWGAEFGARLEDGHGKLLRYLKYLPAESFTEMNSFVAALNCNTELGALWPTAFPKIF